MEIERGDIVELKSEVSHFGAHATVLKFVPTKKYGVQIKYNWWASGWIKKESINKVIKHEQ